MEPLGIYLHIPFCRKACHYCNFHFTTQLSDLDSMIDSICAEIRLRAQYNAILEPISTIYFGGGTPSLLNAEQLERIFKTLKEYYDISSVEEITLEINPEDVTSEYLQIWKSLGIQRYSLGIQSLKEEDLQYLGRLHGGKESRGALKVLQDEGVDFSVDFIYGMPTLAPEDLVRFIETVHSFGAVHLSAYALTLEEQTVLNHRIKKQKQRAPKEQDFIAQYQRLREVCASLGYQQYEVSNYAKHGYQSKHNSKYWTGANYRAFGPSAHGKHGRTRYKNTVNHRTYRAQIQEGILPETKEKLSEEEYYNELLITGLRTTNGMQIPQEKDWSPKVIAHYRESIKKWSQYLLFSERQGVYVNPENWLMIDYISRELLLI